jgi:hypothetical protein
MGGGGGGQEIGGQRRVHARRWHLLFYQAQAMEWRRDGQREVSTRGGRFLFDRADVELERSRLRSLLCPLGSVSRARKMSNESLLGRGDPIAMGEGVVISSTPLGFSSLLRHAGGSMEVEGCRNGG